MSFRPTSVTSTRSLTPATDIEDSPTITSARRARQPIRLRQTGGQRPRIPTGPHRSSWACILVKPGLPRPRRREVSGVTHLSPKQALDKLIILMIQINLAYNPAPERRTLVVECPISEALTRF